MMGGIVIKRKRQLLMMRNEVEMKAENLMRGKGQSNLIFAIC